MYLAGQTALQITSKWYIVARSTHSTLIVYHIKMSVQREYIILVIPGMEQ